MRRLIKIQKREFRQLLRETIDDVTRTRARQKVTRETVKDMRDELDMRT